MADATLFLPQPKLTKASDADVDASTGSHCGMPGLTKTKNALLVSLSL